MPQTIWAQRKRYMRHRVTAEDSTAHHHQIKNSTSIITRRLSFGGFRSVTEKTDCRVGLALRLGCFRILVGPLPTTKRISTRYQKPRRLFGNTSRLTRD